MGTAIMAKAGLVVDFTALEGFADGLLDGQQNWIARPEWTVDVSNGSALIDAEYKSATYNVASSSLSNGESVCCRVELHYKGSSLSAPTKTTSMIKFGFVGVGDNTYDSTGLDCGVLKVVAGGYAYLRGPDDGAVTYIRADITDYLAVEYTLMMGSNAASSSMSFTLYNLTDEKSASGSYTGLRQAVFDAASSTGVFTSIQSYMLTSNTAGITSIAIDSVTFSAVNMAPLPSLNTAFFDSLKSSKMTSSPLVKWQQFGPGMSGYIDKFWINNGDPDAMYTELDMGNGHVTLNRGKFWQSYKEIDGNGEPGDVTGIEFSYQNPDLGLLMAKSGIFSTTNRGRSWNFLVDIDPTNSEKHSVLTVDPGNDNNWYIGAGQHWMIKDTHFNKDGLVYSSDGNYSQGFILKSTDKGQSWTKVTSIFPADSDFSKIIVDPRNSNIVYASNQHGLYKSEDAGSSWVLVPGNGLPYDQPRDMGVFYDSASDEFLLYVLLVTHYTPDAANETILASGGVYRSSDGGTNWVDLTGNLGIDLSQSGMSVYYDRYWRAIAYWLGSDTTALKASYGNLPTDIFSQFIRIAVDPTDKDRIYLVHNFKHDYSFPPGNIWMTENGGTNWLAAAREGPYWVTEKDKAYWQSRGQPLGMNTQMAHVDREHRENDNTQSGPRFVFCNRDGGVYTAFAQQVMCSVDHGATWVQIDDDETVPGIGHWVGRGDCNLPGETFCLDTGTPGTYLWGSGEHGLWRNTDDGDLVYPGAIAVEQLTGQSVSDDSQLSIAAIAVHPNDSNKIYTLQFRQTQSGTLRYSSDAGATWQTLSAPVSEATADQWTDQRSLLIDYHDPDNIYFCIPFSEWERWSNTFVYNGPKVDGVQSFFRHGIYKSVDGGVSWSMATNGIPVGSSVYRMAMDPFDSQTLYAALNETHESTIGGLYKTTNGGASWSAIALPSGIVSVNNVVVHKTTGNIYIACGTYDDTGETGGGFVSQDGGISWTLLFDMPYLRHFVPSRANPDVIVANVGKARSVSSLNPGAYVTINGGANWFKINNRHGQPDGIRKIEPDPYDENVLWMGLHGTGFFRANISPLRTGVAKPFLWDWMAEVGLSDIDADDDADGFDNSAEYIAGTVPTNAASFFVAGGVPMSGNGFKVGFDSAVNRLYSVETSTNLLAGWMRLTNGVPGTGNWMEWIDEEGASSRFYRIRVELE
jgi:photosystem II stability/assembly factor-like uncharacterized protein